jgi:hypothetical protein
VLDIAFLCLQAFAWFSDLLVEHAEIFWSLFAVDMDQVLAEQPPDTWDSFPLFQILNDYLRMDGKFYLDHMFIYNADCFLYKKDNSCGTKEVIIFECHHVKMIIIKNKLLLTHCNCMKMFS